MKMDPPSLNSGNAFCTVNSVPRVFRSKVASKCCSVISPSATASPMPALAYRTSILPFSRLTVSNRRSRFADFARLNPDIEMEILSSGELANLTNREADLAIRVVYDRNTLPLNLHGLKGPELFGGVYMSRDRLAAWRAGAPDPIRWIVISSHGIPDWAHGGEV